MPTYAKVRNWRKFQHYTDRKPPWIKLHRELLDDFDYISLPLASKALAPLIWLLAAESETGEVRVDFDWLAFRLRVTEAEAEAGVTPLIQKGFLECDSSLLASRYQVATPEREREAETEVEKAKAPRSPNGSRLPDDWSPSEADIAFAKKERPDVSWQAEADKFRDYWHGVAGAKGRKADWPGTWRNWIRRADGRKQPNGQALSKTAQAFLKLEGMRNGTVDSGRSDAGDAEAALPWLGPPAPDGID